MKPAVYIIKGFINANLLVVLKLVSSLLSISKAVDIRTLENIHMKLLLLLSDANQVSDNCNGSWFVPCLILSTFFPTMYNLHILTFWNTVCWDQWWSKHISTVQNLWCLNFIHNLDLNDTYTRVLNTSVLTCEDCSRCLDKNLLNKGKPHLPLLNFCFWRTVLGASCKSSPCESDNW